MNPPAALQGAMGRERKPFTYTPGGLDLSEIKSERMAKRLMRNAMNQGVPELPPQIQSPPTPSTPMGVPNFNCLPVQVFPSFQLPANPKSLLRTRSTPAEHREPQTSRVMPTIPSVTLKPVGTIHKDSNSKASLLHNVDNDNINNGRPLSMYEYNNAPKHKYNTENNERNDITKPTLPEISFDAEYFEVKPRNDISKENNGYKISSFKQNDDVIIPIKDNDKVPILDLTIKPLVNIKKLPEIKFNNNMNDEENEKTDNDEQRGVRIVKKKKVETHSQNGERNGDAEAEMTVQLPVKKSAAKTETKVEVSKKSLPDGSIEEIKTTTTRTTIDGKTEIKTKTEKTTIPKQDDVEETEEVEEEEECGDVVVQEVEENGDEEKSLIVIKKSEPVESISNIIKNEERSESTSTTTKKVVVIEKSSAQEEEEEEEDIEEEEEPEPSDIKKVDDSKAVEEVIEKQKPDKKVETEEIEVEEYEEDEEEEEVEQVQEQIVKSDKDTESEKVVIKQELPVEHVEEDVEEEEEYEEAEEHETIPEPKKEIPEEPLPVPSELKEEEEESEYTEEEYESEVEEPPKPEPVQKPKEPQEELNKEIIEKVSLEQNVKQEESKETATIEVEKHDEPPQPSIPLREPSIPLDKVEDVEIKPIGAASETIKTVRESTEIIKGPSDSTTGSLSTQTAYNRIENIVTVNRTTKTLDHNYEQLTQSGIPTMKTYFAPERERVSTSPQPAKAYEPLFTTQPQTQPDRRHSLLLERLSTERQMPSDIYQSQINNREQRQWSQEPQSEVVNVSNVKPSTITNSQWYQQSKKENVTYNNVSSSTQSAPSQQLSQPPPETQAPAQQQYQPPLSVQPQQLYQQPPAQQYQQSQTQFQQPQPQYEQHQSSYSDQSTQLTSNSYQNNNYTPTYTPKPTTWANNTYGSAAPSFATQQNQYSYTNKDSSETYQKTSQQYSSSYVPPPWEQDPSYVAPELPTQNYYQPQPNTFDQGSTPGWKPKAAGKFPKPAPMAYIPPAPNQSFVKAVSTNSEPPKLPGRKTYYSEYERRYISVPESTYVPGDNKLQPDPSPQYYYDNSEPTEAVEHQWRKELREFTEKSSQTQQSEQPSVKPPWEEENKYSKATAPAPYTPTPSWSQTLRPQSWRERSFESEFVSNDWSKTNTVGRGRPVSTYGNPSVETVPQRTRGVSVDRYNPNYYQSPIASEHSPVPTHTLNAPVKGYQNPHLPGHHARASAETREQAVPSHHPRNWGDQRQSPIQSRSFKYLQWITGTDE